MQTTKVFTFTDLQSQMMKNFKDFGALFYVDIERDYFVELYLDGFKDPAFRQEHNCNCCKSFLRQYGGLVTIKDNKRISIWDNLEVPEEFQESINNLREYVAGRPITGVFLQEKSNKYDATKLGTKQNISSPSSSRPGIPWNHFFLEVAPSYVSDMAGTIKGQKRATKEVLQRGLEELTSDSVETVLELIAQKSLYRGEESEGALKAFQKLQKQYSKLAPEEKDNFCWSVEGSESVARIRNTAMGTLLIDLSEGMDLDQAVTRFEKVMAPTNYKRPTALVTPKMVEQAKEKLKELGLLESMERRHATEADIRASNILFKDVPQAFTDVFDQVAKETEVNPRSFSKVEEIGIEDFINNVLPNAKSLSVLVENQHLPNFVSLVAPKDPETLSMFKWNNAFSWSYTGGITDSIKEKVKAAGGNVEGALRCSLSWSNYDDLDIHVIEPIGSGRTHKTFYGDRVSRYSGATLDVDMNAGAGRSRDPVENIIFPDKSRMKEGTYKVLVNNYCKRETKDSGYQVQIEHDGQIFDFAFKNNPKDGETTTVAIFDYSKEKGLTFSGEVKSNIVSKEKWGLKTNQFHKVTKFMLSPNHWNEETGNKHYLFFLEGCISDEAPRAFFNEFLKPELEQHRKVMEIVGAKTKIEDSPNQLSGIGFSETVRNELLVKVTGRFDRVLRVKF